MNFISSSALHCCASCRNSCRALLKSTMNNNEYHCVLFATGMLLSNVRVFRMSYMPIGAGHLMIGHNDECISDAVSRPVPSHGFSAAYCAGYTTPTGCGEAMGESTTDSTTSNFWEWNDHGDRWWPNKLSSKHCAQNICCTHVCDAIWIWWPCAIQHPICVRAVNKRTWSCSLAGLAAGMLQVVIYGKFSSFAGRKPLHRLRADLWCRNEP